MCKPACLCVYNRNARCWWWRKLFPGKFSPLWLTVWPPDRSQALQVQSYNPHRLPPHAGKTQQMAAGAQCQMCQVIPANRLRIREFQSRRYAVCVCVWEQAERLEKINTQIKALMFSFLLFFFSPLEEKPFNISQIAIKPTFYSFENKHCHSGSLNTRCIFRSVTLC